MKDAIETVINNHNKRIEALEKGLMTLSKLSLSKEPVHPNTAFDYDFFHKKIETCDHPNKKEPENFTLKGKAYEGEWIAMCDVAKGVKFAISKIERGAEPISTIKEVFGIE